VGTAALEAAVNAVVAMARKRCFQAIAELTEPELGALVS